nr:hypothetical protein [Mesorhizobium sp.]
MPSATASAQREDRSDRKIDAAAQHHHGHADDDKGELAELAGRSLQRGELEETRNDRTEDAKRRHQRQEGNGVVGPALGQNLANQMVRHEIVAPGLEAFAKIHRLLLSIKSKQVAGMSGNLADALVSGLTLPPLRPAAPSGPSSCRA